MLVEFKLVDKFCLISVTNLCLSSLNRRIDNLLYLSYENKYRLSFHTSIPIRMKFIEGGNPLTLPVSL